jgi:hypothetical protein
MGMKCKLFVFLALFFVATMSASAASISIQIIQHDKSQDSVRSSSYKIEESLMDYFFDTGYIVTSSPAVVSNGAEEDNTAYHKAVNEALEGSFDVLVSVITEYDVKDSKQSEADVLSNIKRVSWKIINVANGKVLYSGTKEIGVVLPENDNEKGISTFAKTLAQDIDSDLQRIQ